MAKLSIRENRANASTRIRAVILYHLSFTPSTANLVPALCVVTMSFLDCTHVAAVMSLLVMSVGFTGFAFSAFLVNPFDIAPRYAISITSVTNSIACIPGILTPYVVAEVTTDVSL